MATYIQGLTDYIPQIQPFKPDLNFYSKVLQMSQDKYDAAKREIGTLYGSLLYSPLTRQNNIQRRDDFFKNIEHQIKKISAMDLSLAQNQEAAMKIFDPIINDKKISHDWSFTKRTMDEMQRGENFRYCTDPKKCGGTYSPESITYLNLKLDEYAKADDDVALGMDLSDVKFVPFNNIQKDAIDWAKATGFLVEGADFNGGYIVKKQNGQAIKVPLMQLFLSTFGNDPKYREHYKQLGYINKRNWINENLASYENDQFRTEAAYYNDVITKTIKNLEEDAKNYEETHSQISTKNKALKNKLSTNGVIASDVTSIAEMVGAQEEEGISDGVMGYYRDLQQRISNLSVNSEDTKAFGAMIESIVGDGFMKMDLAKATEELAAVWNTTTDIKENQFSLNAQKHQHAIDEMKLQFQLDDEAAINSRLYDIGKEYALKYMEGGLPNDNEGTPEEGGQGNLTPPGSVDLYSISQGSTDEARKTVYNNQKQYNATVINALKSIADDPRDPAASTHAKNELKAMLGGFYDEKNNLFVKGNAKYKNYSEITLDGKNEYQIYKNAQIVMDRNKGNYLRSIVNSTSSIAEETNQLVLLRDGYSEVLSQNNKLIRSSAAAQKEVKDKILFDGLFEESSDGSVNVITSEDAYVKKMMGTKFNKPMSPETKEKYLRKAYQKNFGLYKEMHNNGPEYGINGIMAPNGMGLGTGIDGNARAEGRSWTSRYASPNSYANKGYLSFMKNVNASKGATKALIGTGHTAGDVKDDENSTARTVFNQYQQGLLSGKYATDSAKEKAPNAKITYFDVAGESANMVSVSLTDINPEWLKSLATNKEGTMIGGTNISDITEKGVTMYMTKEAANNLFTTNFKQKPGDVYINSGRQWTISRPDGGYASIQKVAGNIEIKGYLIGYDKQGNRRQIPIPNTLSGRDISGEKLIQQYTSLINDQQTSNVNYMETGSLPRVYDEQSLIRALREGMSPGGQAATGAMDKFRSYIGK